MVVNDARREGLVRNGRSYSTSADGIPWVAVGDLPATMPPVASATAWLAPSSSQVQDTRFSSWEQGFESPWGHYVNPCKNRAYECGKPPGTLADAMCQSGPEIASQQWGAIFFHRWPLVHTSESRFRIFEQTFERGISAEPSRAAGACFHR